MVGARWSSLTWGWCPFLAGQVYVKRLSADSAGGMVLGEASRPGRRTCRRGGLVSWAIGCCKSDRLLSTLADGLLACLLDRLDVA